MKIIFWKSYPETMVAESVHVAAKILKSFSSFRDMAILPYNSMECYCQQN